MSLDDASYPLLWQLSKATSTPPEFFLAVMASESGLRPEVPNLSGADYYGLNQISGQFLRQRGITPDDYLNWPASKQLSEVILPYFKGVVSWWGRPPRSPGVLHGMQLCLPDTTKDDSPGYVLAPVSGSPCGTAAYAANKGLDFNKDGKITFADLDASLCARVIPNDPFRSALKKLYADPAANGASPTILCTNLEQGAGLPWGKLLVGVALLGGTYAAYRYRHELVRFIAGQRRRPR